MLTYIFLSLFVYLIHGLFNYMFINFLSIIFFALSIFYFK